MRKAILIGIAILLLTGCAKEAEPPVKEVTTIYVMFVPMTPTDEPTPTTAVEYIGELDPIFYLTDEERFVVESIVMGESGGEPYEGQVLVAQCVLNSCLKDGLQPSEVRTKYKYSGWNTDVTDSVKEAVSAVFDDNYKVTEEEVMYFYAPKYCKSRWHETQKFVTEVGGHRFFAEWED